VGTREGEVGQVDVNGLVGNIALLRGQAMFERGIELELNLDPDLPFVWGESHAIQQALVNIVLNAEKVVPGKEGLVRISTTQGEDDLEVLIEDNGPGVPQDIKESIFYPFFTTDITKGTGLGLSIAQSAIEDHGGRIEVGDSEMGGALFKVSIPFPSSRKDRELLEQN
jgi:signal transduction histidine kinase